jgi:hypothetical protein
MLEDTLGGRVTIPLRNYPAERRRQIVDLLRGPVLASDAEVDEATVELLAGG